MSGIYSFSSFPTSVDTVSDSILDISESTYAPAPSMLEEGYSSISSSVPSFSSLYPESYSTDSFTAETETSDKNKRFKKSDTRKQDLASDDFTQFLALDSPIIQSSSSAKESPDKAPKTDIQLNPDLLKIFTKISQNKGGLKTLATKRFKKLGKEEKGQSNQKMKKVFKQELEKLEKEFPGFHRDIYCTAMGAAYPYSNGENRGYRTLTRLLKDVPLPITLASLEEVAIDIDKKELQTSVAEQLQALQAKYDHQYDQCSVLYIHALGKAFPYSEKPRSQDDIYKLLRAAEGPVKIVPILPYVEKYFLELAESKPKIADLTKDLPPAAETNQNEELNPEVLNKFLTVKNRKIGINEFVKNLPKKNTLSVRLAKVENTKMQPIFISQYKKLREKESEPSHFELCVAIAMAYPYSDGSTRTPTCVWNLVREAVESAESKPKSADLTKDLPSTAKPNQNAELNPVVLSNLLTIKNRKITIDQFVKNLPKKNTLPVRTAKAENTKMQQTFISQYKKLREKESEPSHFELCIAIAMAYPYSDGSTRIATCIWKLVKETVESSEVPRTKGKKRKEGD